MRTRPARAWPPPMRPWPPRRNPIKPARTASRLREAVLIPSAMIVRRRITADWQIEGHGADNGGTYRHGVLLGLLCDSVRSDGHGPVARAAGCTLSVACDLCAGFAIVCFLRSARVPEHGAPRRLVSDVADGVLTSVVFGPYHYTDVCGPCFLGMVPYTVPLVWFILVYPSYVIAEWLVPVGWAGQKRSLVVAGCGATAVTAVDLALDPVMVGAGAWVWHVNGAFFGIPVQNYLGWWLTVFVIVSIYLRLGALPRVWRPVRSVSVVRLAILSYGVFAIATIAVALHMRLPGPAFAALLITGIWVAAGLYSTREAQTGMPAWHLSLRYAPHVPLGKVLSVLCQSAARCRFSRVSPYDAPWRAIEAPHGGR